MSFHFKGTPNFGEAQELERPRPIFVQKATRVPPPVKGKTVRIRVDGQKIEAAIDELGGFTFIASGKPVTAYYSGSVCESEPGLFGLLCPQRSRD